MPGAATVCAGETPAQAKFAGVGLARPLSEKIWGERGISDIFLKVDYEGDTGMAFINGRLVADNFNNGTVWLIGLKRFAPEILEKGVCLVFHPLRQGVVKNVSSQFAGRFEFEGQEKLAVHSISAIPEYCVRIGTGG